MAKTAKKTPVGRTTSFPALKGKKNPTKKAVKKTATKKVVKKTTTKKAPEKKSNNRPKYGDAGNTGIDRTFDVAWTPKKVAVFKALKALKATSATNARSAKDVAAKASDGVLPKHVLHYCYHAQVSGLTGVGTVENVRGHAVYLTAKGAKVDLTKVLKDKE